ncbi:uncharacterized protein LOC133492765 [Syngnathoides biaculeatus]|uniref:uncharacterized protein LOC133492765 n=1 Tax=Syngnathoides biaculeatus TaxID=300417 RepID=UPI002ADE950B|nr:uncharacterized protein LOC133492765 [Syngnathoides biaculeatus]XP_061661396.1 uncharacterized protein LOC133492765 [Syngnathoides biaculeatus]
MNVVQYTKTDSLKAEIVWTLKVICSNYGYKSCENNSKGFAVMFPDSDMAKNYHCGERKTSYLATFGIAAHFSSLPRQKVKAESEYVLLFESLNHEMQDKQLDIHVRLWNDDRVRTSEFLGHSAATGLQERLDPIVCDFGHQKLLQLSMDGPNVNWKLYKSIQEQIEKMTTRRILQNGSCGRHILHNAFRICCEAAGWGVEDFLSSLYNLFRDAPARREDFKQVTGSDTLPLMFCKHRWLENIVAERAITLMPHVRDYCEAATTKKVTCPTNSSLTAVQKAAQDPIFVAKLHFFLMCARLVEPFLKLYQTDKPMLPFLAKDMCTLIKTLMEKFIKPEVLFRRKKKKAASLSSLVKINVDDKSHWVDLSKVGIGFAAERLLLKSWHCN